MNLEDDVYDRLINFSQFDIRRLINIMEELSYHFTSKTIDCKRFNNFVKKSREKDEDIGLFKATY